jgi:predicted lipoprotein
MKPINKIILSISILLLAQLSFAADHEAGEKHEKTVIGSEQSSTGAKLNIYGGDLATVDIWGAYITAHNTRDLDAIHKANADDFMGWAANGIIVNGPAAQAFLKEWFAASSPSLYRD